MTHEQEQAAEKAVETEHSVVGEQSPGEHIVRLEMDGRQIILLGTAHVSRESAKEVARLIDEEDPDTVAVELCQARYESLKAANRWKDMDIVKVIRQKKAGLLLTNLVLSSYQRRLAEQFGIEPGEEMKVGVRVAEEQGKTLVLADRNIQVTLSRVWRGMGLWGKLKLLFSLIFSVFADEEISEAELEALKGGDALTAALNEMSRSFPELKTTLIDERDQYLAEKIRTAPGDKVLAILGAGHLPGIRKELGRTHDLKALDRLPAKKMSTRWVGWVIPLIILGLIVTTFRADAPAGMDQVIAWILWNGSLSALGAALAWAHPLSILTAFLVAPISSLNPLLAAGWFAGLAEAMIRKPKVADFEALGTDLTTFKGFWKNRVTRILLVVVFANLGSTAGTLIGGAEVIRVFISTVLGN